MSDRRSRQLGQGPHGRPRGAHRQPCPPSSVPGGGRWAFVGSAADGHHPGCRGEATCAGARDERVHARPGHALPLTRSSQGDISLKIENLKNRKEQMINSISESSVDTLRPAHACPWRPTPWFPGPALCTFTSTNMPLACLGSGEGPRASGLGPGKPCGLAPTNLRNDPCAWGPSWRNRGAVPQVPCSLGVRVPTTSLRADSWGGTAHLAPVASHVPKAPRLSVGRPYGPEGLVLCPWREPRPPGAPAGPRLRSPGTWEPALLLPAWAWLRGGGPTGPRSPPPGRPGHGELDFDAASPFTIKFVKSELRSLRWSTPGRPLGAPSR